MSSEVSNTLKLSASRLRTKNVFLLEAVLRPLSRVRYHSEAQLLLLSTAHGHFRSNVFGKYLGDDDNIVFILTESALSFSIQQSDYLAREPFNANKLSKNGLIVKEFFLQCLTNYAYSTSGPHLSRFKKICPLSKSDCSHQSTNW